MIRVMRRASEEGYEKSPFYSYLAQGVLKGKRSIGWCFYSDSLNTFYPLHTSLFKLISDGWELEEKK